MTPEPADPTPSEDRLLARARLDAERAGPADGPPLVPFDTAELARTLVDPPSDFLRCGGSLPAVTAPDLANWGPPPPVPGYTLSHAVGAGGQGAVYHGTQVSTGAAVAVKVLRLGSWAPAADRRRLDREVAALAAVTHPHVVPIVDRGLTADEAPFIAMPFVAGRPLDEAAADLRARPDQPMPALGLMEKVLSALAAVHRAGLVHRDVKPSNVLVDDAGEPWLLDFGLAREVAASDQSVTAPGRFLGTIAWASPEQAEGRVDRLDVRSDVYGVGLLLYHALTGEPPYPTTGTIPEVLSAVVGTPPVPPSRRLPPRPAVRPAHLDAVVLRALAKRPEDRYQTADEFLADVRRLLSGDPPLARVTVDPRAGRRRRRFRLAAATSTLGSVAWLGWSWLVPPAAVRPFAMPTTANTVKMELVLLPAGTGWSGSLAVEQGHGENERHHLATVVRPFRVGATEVTRAQYAAVTGGPPPAAADADLPVEGVTGDQAEAFCAALSAREGRRYRLPTEVEWEYACRAGSQGPWAGTGRADDMGWHLGNSGAAAHPVGGKSPNHWGLYDMSGNVAEWCSDTYDEGYEPQPWTRGHLPRTVRGGHYGSAPEGTRSAARRPGPPEDGAVAAAHVGFRVVLEVSDDKPATAPAKK